MKTKRLGTKTYYMVKQVSNEDVDICTGCCFFPAKEAGGTCPEDASKLILCQQWDGDRLMDYIFFPKTNQGLADFVAHKLEHS